MLTWAPTVFEQLPFQSIPFAHDGPTKLLLLSLISSVQIKKACLLADIRKKKMGYFDISSGIAQSNKNYMHLEGKIEGVRSMGRPRTMWMGNNTERSGLGYVEATRKAQDRNYWW